VLVHAVTNRDREEFQSIQVDSQRVGFSEIQFAADASALK